MVFGCASLLPIYYYHSSPSTPHDCTVHAHCIVTARRVEILRESYSVEDTVRTAYFTISCVQNVLAWLAETHAIVKRRVPLYDSTCAESATPAIKNGPDRKVETLFLNE